MIWSGVSLGPGPDGAHKDAEYISACWDVSFSSGSVDRSITTKRYDDFSSGSIVL